MLYDHHYKRFDTKNTSNVDTLFIFRLMALIAVEKLEFHLVFYNFPVKVPLVTSASASAVGDKACAMRLAGNPKLC